MTASPAPITASSVPALSLRNFETYATLPEFWTDAETFSRIAEAHPDDKAEFIVTHYYTIHGEVTSDVYMGTLSAVMGDIAWLDADADLLVHRSPHSTTTAHLGTLQRALDAACSGLRARAAAKGEDLYNLGVHYFTTRHGAVMEQDGSGDLTFGYTLEDGWQGVAMCIYRPAEGWIVITEI